MCDNTVTHGIIQECITSIHFIREQKGVLEAYNLQTLISVHLLAMMVNVRVLHLLVRVDTTRSLTDTWVVTIKVK